LEDIQGNLSINTLQKRAILGKSHIIQKVLQCEFSSLSGGDRRWFKKACDKMQPYNNNNNPEH
jgi:hypothetical protein